MSECVLKTLACRGLRVGPSKFPGVHIFNDEGPGSLVLLQNNLLSCKLPDCDGPTLALSLSAIGNRSWGIWGFKNAVKDRAGTSVIVVAFALCFSSQSFAETPKRGGGREL